MITEVETPPAVARRRFTVAEYHRMAEVGILHEDDRIELIHGEIIKMSGSPPGPIGNPHSSTVRRLINKLTLQLGPQFIIDAQNPVQISDYSEPEPDIVVLPFRDDYYADGVTPADVLLIIEVSDTTLRYDQTIKLPLYAAAGIPEVWIVDVGQQLKVHRHPRGEQYQSASTLSRDETASATQFSLTVVVKELIG